MKLPSNIGNLINLCHLDIGGAYQISEMPLGMEELKCLRKLSNFIVGKNVGSNLKFPSGRLCVSRLNNAIDFDPRDLVFRDKDLKELLLEWESHFDDSRKEVVEEKVLDILLPHQNLEMLTITCYGGRRFPSWIGDPSFSNIKYLKLERCKNCISLPSLGLLALLKVLTFKKMASLKSIGSELYGKNRSKPFQSLETLRFEYLQEWKHWEPNEENQYVDAFPCLRRLWITRCPKLSGRLPDHLPSLEKVVIENCNELLVSFSSIPMLSELEINGCKRLACNSQMHSSSLKYVTLSTMCEFDDRLKPVFQKVKCFNVKVVNGEQLMCLLQNDIFQDKTPQGLQTSVRRLSIDFCSSLVSFPEACSLSSLTKLEISNCQDLTSLSQGIMHDNARLKSLHIRHCPSLKFIVRGNLPPSLKRLKITECDVLECLWDDREKSCSSDNTSASLLEVLDVSNCPSLTCLSSSGQLSYTVRDLHLRSVPKLESIAESFDSNASLERSFIWDCEILKSLPEGLHNLSRLQDIFISDCPSIVCFPQGGLPSNIVNVAIRNCKKLKSLPSGFHTLNSLRGLAVVQCPSIAPFPEGGFPKNLIGLEIEGGLNMYKPFVEWGLYNFTSLTFLHISGCPEAESFPQPEMGMLLPTSLTHLTLKNFPRLKSLSNDGFHSFDSLENMSIQDCPSLISFPEHGLPSSLMELRITNCPLLKEECRRQEGKYWSKICDIPSVHIDDKFIYDPEGRQNVYVI